MEKLIKIKARMIDGTIRKFRTTNFTVKSFRSNSEEANKTPVIYIKLDDGYTFVCKNIEVEQKEVEPATISEREQVNAVLAANNIKA